MLRILGRCARRPCILPSAMIAGPRRFPTPTAGHSGTIFLSIELSQKVWLVTLHSPDRDKVSRHHVAGGGYAELLDLIERIRARVERKLVYRPEVASCYEAGYDGFWLHRLL